MAMPETNEGEASRFTDKRIISSDSHVCEPAAAYEDIDATVLGISIDSRFSNAAFASAHHIEFPLLSDYTRSTIDAYDIRFPDLAGMPGYDVAQRSVFVIDATGTVVWRWLADNPGEEPPYDEVLSAVISLTSTA